jgi:hypothetical protein
LNCIANCLRKPYWEARNTGRLMKEKIQNERFRLSQWWMWRFTALWDVMPSSVLSLCRCGMEITSQNAVMFTSEWVSIRCRNLCVKNIITELQFYKFISFTNKNIYHWHLLHYSTKVSVHSEHSVSLRWSKS